MARVEALSGLSAIPAEYIRPEEERRDLGDAFELEVASIHAPVRIPVVDIGAFDSEEPSRRAACVEAVRAAAADWGVMHIAEHGIPSELIERLRAAGMAFFALPIEKKEAYANDPSAGRMQGYGSKLATNASGQLEWEDYFFHLVHPFHMADLALWPKHPPEYLEVTKEFGRQMRELSSKMLSILSLGMGLQPERLERELSGVEQSSSDLLLKLKINYYPRCPQPDLAVGVEAHTDVSSLSFILHNGVPGLQVHHQGSWVTARSVPDTIIVHIGDALEILTNARYTSVLHRGLVNREAVRVSWVVFCEPPPDDVVLQPLPELVTDAASARFTPRTFAQHLERKLFKKAQEGQGTTAIDGNSRPEK